MKKFAVLLLAVTLAAPFASPADTPAAPSATMQGDAARPAAGHWIRNELYFGIGRADMPDDLAELRWQAFLDREVTPRFPDGLTVVDAYGQWLSRGSKNPERLHSKVLIILCEDTAANQGAISAIRAAYKKETRDKSVLLVTEKVDVSF